MRLVHPLLSRPIHFQEGQVQLLIAEDPRIFRELVRELSAQSAGEEGSFVLSLNFEPLDCARHLHVLRDYTNLELEDRKLKTRFSALVQSIAREEMGEASDELAAGVTAYLERLAVKTGMPIAFGQQDFVAALLKAADFRLELEERSLPERLTEHLSVYSALMANQCFVLVGAKAFLNDKELMQLYQMSFYQKWRLLLLEPRCSKPLTGENPVILDKDLCELRLDEMEGLL